MILKYMNYSYCYNMYVQYDKDSNISLILKNLFIKYTDIMGWSCSQYIGKTSTGFNASFICVMAEGSQ